MGGLLKLYYIDSDDFVSLEIGQESLYELTLADGAVIHEIEFTQDTGKLSETEDDTDNGIQYNVEIKCRIPGFGVSGNNLLGDLRQKKIMILAEDSNENFILAGSPGAYFSVNISGATGEAQVEPNSRILTLTASLAESVKFIESPF